MEEKLVVWLVFSPLTVHSSWCWSQAALRSCGSSGEVPSDTTCCQNSSLGLHHWLVLQDQVLRDPSHEFCSHFSSSDTEQLLFFPSVSHWFPILNVAVIVLCWYRVLRIAYRKSLCILNKPSTSGSEWMFKRYRCVLKLPLRSLFYTKCDLQVTKSYGKF